MLHLLPCTIIHNDFNPRNVAIRKDGRLCIYDWELSMLGIPHRDVIEMLCFVLADDFDKGTLLDYLQYHYSHYQHLDIPWAVWKVGYEYALKEFIATRAVFYLADNILNKYDFAERIFLVSFRMLGLLESENQI